MVKRRNYFFIILLICSRFISSKCLGEDTKSFDQYFKKEKEIHLSTKGLNVGYLREMNIGIDDRIIFLDARGKQLLVFDQNGTYVKKIGQSGQGPGEYVVPLAVCTDNDGCLYIVDSSMRRINSYDREGNFLKSFNFSVIHSQPAILRVDSNKNVLLASLTKPLQPSGKRVWLNKYDENGKYIKSFFENNLPDDWVARMYPSFTFDIHQNVIYAMQINRYEIYVFDANGALIHTMGSPPEYFKKPDEKYFVDESKYKSLEALRKELIRLSESWTRIVRLDVVDDRSLIVVALTNGLVKGCKQKYLLDIWSIKGEPVASRIPTDYDYLCSDKKGSIYFMVKTNEETEAENDPDYVIGKYRLLSPVK